MEWAQLAVHKEKRNPVPCPSTAPSADAASTVTAPEPAVWDDGGDGRGWEEADLPGGGIEGELEGEDEEDGEEEEE